MRHAHLAVLTLFAIGTAVASEASQRTLTFEDRVRAQEAIESVYYAHQIGAKKPFEEAVPRAVLESKVHKYLDQTAALEQYWKTPVTDAMLERELLRMARGTRMPERLLELYAALGNDAFLIKECLARATLVDRLARSFHASDVPKSTWDVWWETAKSSLRVDSVAAVAAESSLASRSACTPGDTWDNGILDDLPSSRFLSAAVWTGSLMVVWGGSRGGTHGALDTGARYDPATDTWSPTSMIGPPSPRFDHTAVWTGTLMVVWGGYDSISPTTLKTGGRYDPASDSWTPMSTTAAPAGRQYHTAVWTGGVMIVWGGNGQLNTGGRYDPSSDTWTPTSTVGAPSGREYHSAVWTGTEMVIWGGQRPNVELYDTGGRYNPATNTWTPTALVGAPSKRYLHSAVWTGSRMVVWGGTVPLNSGGQYDPATDSWVPTSLTGAPPGLRRHTAVWTGTQMIVWGGEGASSVPPKTGGRYDPAADTWLPTSTLGAPAGRFYHTGVWTGSLMIVWGGDVAVSGAPLTDTGGRYDPAGDSWTPTSTTGAPTARASHTAAWTGSIMVVWGGSGDAGYLNDGGRYDPATDSWSPTAAFGAPSARSLHTVVWTGSTMVIWGGADSSGPFDTGGRYDPAGDRWTPTSTLGAPSPRSGHSAVWTGSSMVVWGGGVNTGGRYDPVADTWTATSTTGAPTARSGQSGVWTGSAMLVWGGDGTNTGGRYDPVADTWSATTTTGAPSARSGQSGVWTGSRLVIWGGNDGSVKDTGGRYDPAADQWTSTSTAGAPLPREFHTAVWTGNQMVVWGGYGFDPVTDDNEVFATGGRYDHATDTWLPTSGIRAPGARQDHSVVWTGSHMIVWGGNGGSNERSGGRYVPTGPVDGDGDGFAACQGDCNDANPNIHPGAVETCNGLDDDCNGAIDEDANGVDTDADGIHNACDDCRTIADPSQSDFDHDGEGDACDLNDGLIFVYATDKNYREWQAESGYTTWNSYRGSLAVLRTTGEYTQAPGLNPLAAHDCVLPDPYVLDLLVPDPGDVAFNLVTGVVGGVESSLGTNSAGVPRANANPCP